MITPEQLVEREVICCISSLVSTLANGSSPNQELQKLCDEALELCMSTLDYEEAARDAGLRQNNNGEWQMVDTDGEIITFYDAQEACEFNNIDPYESEIFEHWVVTGWLQDELAKRGERVGYLDDLQIWGRSTTGRSIYMDHVIEEICKDLNNS